MMSTWVLATVVMSVAVYVMVAAYIFGRANDDDTLEACHLFAVLWPAWIPLYIGLLLFFDSGLNGFRPWVRKGPLYVWKTVSYWPTQAIAASVRLGARHGRLDRAREQERNQKRMPLPRAKTVKGTGP